MKTITVGELRQNPTAMLDDVEAGGAYRITRHGHDVGFVVPPSSEPHLIPPKRSGGATTAKLPRVDPKDGIGIDELLDEMKGQW